jgi:predicted ATPase
MHPSNSNLIVISGGPGAGKTTLLEVLRTRGHRCAAEVSREIIREQRSSGGRALPSDDQAAYADLMLARSLDSFLENQHSQQLTFFDRGLPDTLCYARLINLRNTLPIEAACRQYRYANPVFLAPPWQSIYVNDPERHQTFAEASAVFDLMADVYQSCGYRTVLLPLATPAERADFVLSHLSALP